VTQHSEQSGHRIAFVCVQNAGRSQMAPPFAEQERDRRGVGDRIEIVTGGTQPADHVHDIVVEAMAEVDIDISDRTPREVTPMSYKRSTSSSPWAVRPRTCAQRRGTARTVTGGSTIHMDVRSRRSALSATKLRNASMRCSMTLSRNRYPWNDTTVNTLSRRPADDRRHWVRSVAIATVSVAVCSTRVGEMKHRLTNEVQVAFEIYD